MPILACAGAVAGTDGLLVEVHPKPEKALSDGEQSLTFDQFEAMMRDLERYAPLAAKRAELDVVVGGRRG